MDNNHDAGEALLPEGFEDLLQFVPGWVSDDPQGRWEIRARSSMEEIRHFYDAVLKRSEDILAHVEKFNFPDLPPPEMRLYLLLLALAQAAMAVEIHNSPRARNSPYPHQVRFISGAQPIA